MTGAIGKMRPPSSFGTIAVLLGLLLAAVTTCKTIIEVNDPDNQPTMKGVVR